ncbi:MAG: MarR family winged helix-turn-helix transcriptional regulator [Bacteroidia bacterium]
MRSVDFDIKITWLSIAKMYNVRAVKEDITTNIGFVLIHIDAENGTPATKIAPLMGMEPRSLTRMLASLEERGLIYRQADEKDKRIVRIFLTEEGIEKRRVAREVVKGFNVELTEQIAPEKLNIFFQVIDQIQEISKEYHAKYLENGMKE